MERGLVVMGAGYILAKYHKYLENVVREIKAFDHHRLIHSPNMLAVDCQWGAGHMWPLLLIWIKVNPNMGM